MSKGGGEETIQIFARLRPAKDPSPFISAHGTSDESRIQFRIPKSTDSGYINNQKEFFDFRFNGVFEPSSKQDEIFAVVARKAIDNALQGYNSTIFAYGQTGSGKTYTITGGAERYVDRGIIPRSISYIFEELSKRSGVETRVHISYLEIYNNVGYDLLDPNHESQTLEDLPKVHLLEDEFGSLHLRNLSAHLANSEEDALNLLFLGDTNRVVSETPMNPVSSRSHCVFTISIESRDSGSEVVRMSKLHLVDLAGSERVAKTMADGTSLQEARYINISLHFLEQVIIALSDRSKGKDVHVPYRNTLLTTVLRDSLGGNCKTVMIATINPDSEHVQECVSTCRFALRVASVKQQAVLNEAQDPHLVIRRLKKEVAQLKEELMFYKKKCGDEDVEDEYLLDADRRRCQSMVEEYISDPSPEATLVLGNMAWIRESFRLMKEMVRRSQMGKDGGGMSGGIQRLPPPVEDEVGGGAGKGKEEEEEEGVIKSATQKRGGGSASSAEDKERMRQLQLQIQQRDNEINILVTMLRKRGGKASISEAYTQTAETDWDGEPPSSSVSIRKVSMSSHPHARSSGSSDPRTSTTMSPPRKMETLLDKSVLESRAKAFEVFRKSYRKNEVIEENKRLLQEKYAEGKTLGESVNASRHKINQYKQLIEQLRVERAMQGLRHDGDSGDGGEGPEDRSDPEEERCLHSIEKEKQQYKENFLKLKKIKSEIENIQKMLEMSRVQLQKDFESWYSTLVEEDGDQDDDEREDEREDEHEDDDEHEYEPDLSESRSASGSRGKPPIKREDMAMDRRVGKREARAPLPPSRGSRPPAPIRTGDQEADDDIEAFYRARETLLRKAGAGGEKG